MTHGPTNKREASQMLKVKDLKEIEDGDVHYAGVPLIGSHTLCGITDIIGSDFVDVSERVNCAGCIAVRNHVLGRNK